MPTTQETLSTMANTAIGMVGSPEEKLANLEQNIAKYVGDAAKLAAATAYNPALATQHMETVRNVIDDFRKQGPSDLGKFKAEDIADAMIYFEAHKNQPAVKEFFAEMEGEFGNLDPTKKKKNEEAKKDGPLSEIEKVIKALVSLLFSPETADKMFGGAQQAKPAEMVGAVAAGASAAATAVAGAAGVAAVSAAGTEAPAAGARGEVATHTDALKNAETNLETATKALENANKAAASYDTAAKALEGLPEAKAINEAREKNAETIKEQTTKIAAAKEAIAGETAWLNKNDPVLIQQTADKELAAVKAELAAVKEAAKVAQDNLTKVTGERNVLAATGLETNFKQAVNGYTGVEDKSTVAQAVSGAREFVTENGSTALEVAKSSSATVGSVSPVAGATLAMVQGLVEYGNATPGERQIAGLLEERKVASLAVTESNPDPKAFDRLHKLNIELAQIPGGIEAAVRQDQIATARAEIDRVANYETGATNVSLDGKITKAEVLAIKEMDTSKLVALADVNRDGKTTEAEMKAVLGQLNKNDMQEVLAGLNLSKGGAEVAKNDGARATGQKSASTNLQAL